LGLSSRPSLLHIIIFFCVLNILGYVDFGLEKFVEIVLLRIGSIIGSSRFSSMNIIWIFLSQLVHLFSAFLHNYYQYFIVFPVFIIVQLFYFTKTLYVISFTFFNFFFIALYGFSTTVFLTIWFSVMEFS